VLQNGKKRKLLKQNKFIKVDTTKKVLFVAVDILQNDIIAITKATVKNGGFFAYNKLTG